MKILNLPFDLAQGGESFDSAQDREPVERLVEPFRARPWNSAPFIPLNSKPAQLGRTLTLLRRDPTGQGFGISNFIALYSPCDLGSDTTVVLRTKLSR